VLKDLVWLVDIEVTSNCVYDGLIELCANNEKNKHVLDLIIVHEI